jgi:hypothetical protein
VTRLADARRAVADVGPLLAFRVGSLRGRSRRYAALGLSFMAFLTVSAAVLPAYLPRDDEWRLDIGVLLPSALFGVLLIAVVSASATGGGRELLPREQAVAFPISVTTDHLGALMMAPLNIAWLLQAWLVLGASAYLLQPTAWLLPAQLMIFTWLLAATTFAQVLAWAIEYVRRGPYGVWVVRAVSVGAGALSAWLVASGNLAPLLDRSRLTLWVVEGMLAGGRGDLLPWSWRFLLLVLFMVTAMAAGAVVANLVAQRQPRDELRLESAPYRPRPSPVSELAALVRTDRLGVWRSVPLRRGLLVLGLMPGAVALAGGLDWPVLCILPGLVASGGALLFGVNAWCLDGRGALWRDSLPVSPKKAFVSRVVVLTEVLLFATALTLLLAAFRAGTPTASELVAVTCGAVVVVLQVVTRSLRWSVRNPYAVDLRSSRATPAPPLVMVAYSARLALATTLTGMLFALTARGGVEWSLMFATPFLIFSAYRLVQTGEAWANPLVRSRVVSTVAS